MKRFFIYIVLMFLFSCDRAPFAEHEVKLEKVSDDCSQKQGYFRMNSNLNGERYEFEKCLPAGYNKDHIKSERRGDTVVVYFEEALKAKAVYHVTLDIDSYPRYSFLTIDGETFSIVPYEK